MQNLPTDCLPFNAGGEVSEFTGAIAVTEWWDVNAINYCDAAPYDPQCSEINAYLTRVAQAILGVHLSTFPVI